jgi:hypothetical protein
VTQPEVNVYINKLDIAHFFDTQILGGTPGVVLTIPVAGGDVSGSFLLNAPFGGFKDDNTGLSDPIITPVIGWHNGNFHYSTSFSVFMPAGNTIPPPLPLRRLRSTMSSISARTGGLSCRPSAPLTSIPRRASRSQARWA